MATVILKKLITIRNLKQFKTNVVLAGGNNLHIHRCNHIIEIESIFVGAMQAAVLIKLLSNKLFNGG